MYKIVWSHLFALGIILGVVYYQSNVDGLMNDVLFALLTLEMGFLFYYFKHVLLRGLVLIFWCFFYPYNLNVLFSVADTSWDTAALWTSNGMKSFMLYLAVLVFALIAGTLSIRLILNAFKLNHYIQVFFVMGIAFFASLMFQILRTLGITWKVILSQHLNIFEQVSKALTTINMPFILGLMVVQVMMFMLLDND